MDYKSIISLMKEMNHTDLTRLEIEEEGIRICLEKSPKSTQGQTCAETSGIAGGPLLYHTFPGSQSYSMPMNVTAPMAVPVPVQTATLPAGGSINIADTQGSGMIPSQTGMETAEDVNHKKQVSPMVGTFYAQSSPDKPPFVKAGDRVKKGQTLCIIEAMKLLNEIESEYDGEIVEVLVNNENMVEFGQPLFVIKE